MTETVFIDGLSVEVRRSPVRRTVDLIVDRFGDVVINVPESIAGQDVEQIVRKKQGWVYTKLERKDQVIKSKQAKEFVSGEGFYYLGRKHRLLLTSSPVTTCHLPALRLLDGRFQLSRDAAEDGRRRFVAWYTTHARSWIQNSADALKDRVGLTPHSIGVRDLGYRWGSCNARGDMLFHWRTILLPPRVIRYLILHELVHLKEHSHTPAFYEILEGVAPDRQEIEEWLEWNGNLYSL
jgi:hypothetical protein